MSRGAERRLVRQIDGAIEGLRKAKIEHIAAGYPNLAEQCDLRIATLEAERAASKKRASPSLLMEVIGAFA